MAKLDLWESTQQAIQKWPNFKKYWYEVVGENDKYLECFYSFNSGYIKGASEDLFIFIERIKSEALQSFKGKLAVYLSKIVGNGNDLLAYYHNQNKVIDFVLAIQKLLKGKDFSYDLALLDIAFIQVINEKGPFRISDTLTTNYIVKILQSKIIKDANFQSTIINGLINAPLFNLDNPQQCHKFLNLLTKALDKDFILYGDQSIIELEYLLNCPTLKHCKLIHAIVSSPSVINSGFVYEFCDEALTLDESQLDEFIFHVQNRLVKKEMTFAEAALNYNNEAMEILRTTEERIMPETMVTINTYESELPKFR